MSGELAKVLAKADAEYAHHDLSFKLLNEIRAAAIADGVEFPPKDGDIRNLRVIEFPSGGCDYVYEHGEAGRWVKRHMEVYPHQRIALRQLADEKKL